MNAIKRMLILTTAMVSISSVAQSDELSVLPNNIGRIEVDQSESIQASLDTSSILYKDEAKNFFLYNFKTGQSTKLSGLKGGEAHISPNGEYIYESNYQANVPDILYKNGEYKELPRFYTDDLDPISVGISDTGILLYNSSPAAADLKQSRGRGSHPSIFDTTTGKVSALQRVRTAEPHYGTMISRDGSIVVGVLTPDHVLGFRPIKWDTKSLEYTLLNAPKGSTSATVVNGDGSVIAGNGHDDQKGTEKLYLWKDGSVDPEVLHEEEDALYFSDITTSGHVIVGGTYEKGRAFYWQRDEGVVFLADKLSKAGIDVNNIPLDVAKKVSSDGSLILGRALGLSGESTWLARIGPNPDAVNKPDSDIANKSTSDAANKSTSDVANKSTSDVANKANSKNNGIGVINLADTGRSLESIRTIAPKIVTANVTDSQRLAGQNCFSAEQSFCAFVTASSGYQDQDSNINSLSQVGIGYQILPSLYFGGSIGYRYLGADLYNEGEFSSNALNTSLWASYNQNQSGFNAAASLGYSWGRIDTERRYRNGSRLETAKGDTGYQAYAGTLKVGYGFDLGRKLLLNPFADVSYGQARIDGFTEDSGNFRAKYEDQKGNYWQSNVGLEAVYKATDIVSFSALAAWGQGDGNDIDFTGNIIGTNNWARNESKTEQTRQDWTHLALGADWKIGKNMSLGLDVGGNIGRSDDHQADIYSSVKFQIAF